MSEEDIPCKSPYEPRPNPIPNPNPNPSPNPNPDISNDDENNNSINTCESLGTAISSMLGSVIRDFDSRADAVIRSQDHLSLVIDRLTGGPYLNSFYLSYTCLYNYRNWGFNTKVIWNQILFPFSRILIVVFWVSAFV